MAFEIIRELSRRKFGDDDNYSVVVVQLIRRHDGKLFRMREEWWSDRDDEGHRVDLFPSDSTGQVLARRVVELGSPTYLGISQEEIDEALDGVSDEQLAGLGVAEHG